MSHTPGNWYPVGCWVEHDDDSVADICTCDPAAMGQEHLGRTPEEIEANVRLIAAAPDLLALAYQYANDMRYPPSADSRQRRLAAVEAVLATVKS